LHFCAPHNYQQPTRIWNKDPTLWTWWKSKNFKKFKKGFITLTTSYHMFFFKRWNSPSNWSNVSPPLNNEMWFKFQCHIQINFSTQGIIQQRMTSRLIHHICIHHKIQTCSDSFNNGPHGPWRLDDINLMFFAPHNITK
jgi:hypothetical protein